MADTIMAGGHNPATDWEISQTALESRADVYCLEELLAQRRALVEQDKILKTLHGPGNKWDVKRKIMLEMMKIRWRAKLREQGEKVTEAMIDSYAHADEQYVQFVEDGIAAGALHGDLENQITDITDRIRGREVALNAYNAETRLGR